MKKKARGLSWCLALLLLALMQVGCAGATGNQGSADRNTSPAASFSPATLNFGSQALKVASSAQIFALSNSGNAPLTINSLTITGTNSADFTQTNNCPISPTALSAGSSCTITVIFTPSLVASETAAISISDSAAGSPQSVSVSGAGISKAGPTVTVSPASLNFGSQVLNVASSAQILALSNSGNAPLTINSLTITGTNSFDFTQTNNCPISPATLAAAGSCTINVTFTPSTAASETAAISISDSGVGSPQSVPLSGTGSSGSGSSATFPIGLTIQEAIYSDVSGVDRTEDPVTVGIPLPDAAGITDTSTLGLTGASVGQFRVLGRWPSGNVKWVQVDTQSDDSPGGQNVAISLTNGGTGNFGGSNLATDNGSTITINTGAATFTVKKAYFDLLDDVIVGGKTLVSRGSTGLTIVGPTPGNTICPSIPCTTTYTSSNDPNSTAVIEENGPVRAAIKVTGQFKDSSGDAYMRYTVRLHFFYNKTYVKADVLLQNADYGTSGSFATAYKGFSAFEARLTPALGTGKTYAFGTSSSTPETGSFSGTENAYIYQAYSNDMEDCFFAGGTDLRYDPRSPIARSGTASGSCTDTWMYAQNGYQVVGGSTLLTSGPSSQPPAGWADLSDSTGAGVTVGVYQMAAYWPKSIQFMNGGGEVRIGIWPDQTLYQAGGGQQYFQSWPFYSEHTLYLNFHGAAIAPGTEFAKFNYPLIARAEIAAYNNAAVFPYPILAPTAVDSFYKSLGMGCCIADMSPKIYRGYDWPAGGGGNQDEARWANLLLWLQRGYAGRYIDSKHFYTFQTEQVFARSDYNGTTPFHWRDSFVPSAALDESGEPNNITSLNSNIGCDPGATTCGSNHMEPVDQHAHWYGMIDYYFFTGDESVKDAIEEGPTDSFGNPNVRQVVSASYVTRAVGIALMSQARLYGFYTAIGDTTDAATVLGVADKVFNGEPAVALQVSGYGTSENGTSFTRGVNWCCGGAPRDGKPFETGILNQGIWEYLQAHGTSWSGYNNAFDIAEGISSWAMNEAFINTGTPDTSCTTGAGLTYQIDIDNPNSSTSGAGTLTPGCGQTVWANFFTAAKYNDMGLNLPWTSDFETHLKHVDAHSNPGNWAEYGTFIVDMVINEILNPESYQLVDVPVTVTNQGGGSYVLSWTVPAGAQSYRIKYAANPIVHWVGFNPATDTFIGDPASSVPWFSATNVSSIPAPGAAGTTQTFTVTGLGSSENFAVKAYVKSGP